MSQNKFRNIFIVIGLVIVLFSENLFSIFYPYNSGGNFEIIKTFSFMFVGLIFVLIGLFFNFDYFIDD